MHTRQLLPLTLLLFISASASAYWAPNHREINKQVAAEGRPFDFTRMGQPVRTLDDYLQRVLFISDGVNAIVPGVAFSPAVASVLLHGNDTPDDSPTARLPLLQWIEFGGLWEDGFPDMSEAKKWGGLRAVNHFHDPLSADGSYTGLVPWKPGATGTPYLDLLGHGISATRWVRGERDSALTISNAWGFPAATVSLRQFFEREGNDWRSAGLAAALRSIGQVQHLIEDNSVPDHTRDLAHPGDGFEEFMKEHKDYAKLFAHMPVDQWTVLPLKRIEQYGIRGFWDQDLYQGDPSRTFGSESFVGISEFTNANFFAYNTYATATGPVLFSTLPDGPHAPRTCHLPKHPCVPYPWPRMGEASGAFWSSEAPALPNPRLAFGPANVFPNPRQYILRPENWETYAQPLMSRAHGYAQTALSLLLPPVRAEIVPDSAHPMTQVRVRLSNLADPASPHAVTWTLYGMWLKGIQLPGAASPNYDAGETNLPVPVLARSGVRLAPGQTWESDPVELTLKQRLGLIRSYYTAVVVQASIGESSAQTMLEFGAPIPSAYVLAQQTETVDMTQDSAESEQCCDGGCSTCGHQVSLRQSLVQRVRGHIRLMPTALDMLGREAKPGMRKVISDNARLAGVALIGLGREDIDQLDVLAPSWPQASTLTLTGSSLKRQSGGLWLRAPDAPDVADPESFDFEATIDLRDFIYPSNDPKGTAILASNTVFLVAWTTSGSMYLQKLQLWPALGDQPAATTLVTDRCTDGVRDVSAGAFSGCWPMEKDANFCPTQHDTWRVHFVWANAGESAIPVNDSDQLLAFGPAGYLSAVEVAGMPVLYSSIGQLQTCPVEQLDMFHLQGMRVCGAVESGIFAYNATRTTGAGGCPATAPDAPELPRTAKYQRIGSEDDVLKYVLGRSDHVEKYIVELR